VRGVGGGGEGGRGNKPIAMLDVMANANPIYLHAARTKVSAPTLSPLSMTMERTCPPP